MSAARAGGIASVDAMFGWQRQLAQWRGSEGYAHLPLVVRAGLGDPAAIVEQHYELTTKGLELQRHLALAWIHTWEQALRR